MALTRLLSVCVALAVAPQVLAGPVKSWDTKKWEDYDTYHTRYNALDCKHKHDTDFFKQCCGPLRAGASLSSRPDICDPSKAVNGTESVANAASVDTNVDDGECTEDDTAIPDTSVDDSQGIIEVPEGQDCPDGYEAFDPNVDSGKGSPDTSGGDPANDDASSGGGDDGSSSGGGSGSGSGDNSGSGSGGDAGDSGSGSETTTFNAKPSSTAKPKPSSTSSPKSTPTNDDDSGDSGSGGSGSGDSFTGKITFYSQGGVAGACGKVHKDSDLIGAMNFQRYGNVNRVSSLCGKAIEITNPANGKSVRITIEDACPSCKGKNDVDLSEAAFTRLATKSQGIATVNWRFVD